LPSYVASQTHYNLLHRLEYEGELSALCTEHGLSGIAYFALAQGFLTGKYLQPGDADSKRQEYVADYLSSHGNPAQADEIVQAVAKVAADQQVSVAAVAIAWLLAQPTVTAAIASARTPTQLADQFASQRVIIGPAELELLGNASAPVERR
jgi:aryl-alcohol dehydrogenase-like predicted oxidoreductase